RLRGGHPVTSNEQEEGPSVCLSAMDGSGCPALCERYGGEPSTEADLKVLARLRSRTRVAISTLLRCYDVMLAGTISAQPLPTWSLIPDYPDGPVSRPMLVRQSTCFMKS